LGSGIVHTLLAGSSELYRARAYERLLEAGCEDVLVVGSRDELARLLPEIPQPLVVITGDGLSSRPYLQVAARASAPALLLLDADPHLSAHALIDIGARGVLREDVAAQSLAGALDAVRSGLLVLDPALVLGSRENTLESPRLEGSARPRRPLTRREEQILSLIAAGEPNKGIARRLGVSSNTVKFHLAAIFTKLGVTTRAEAVAEAIRLGEVSL
jgi:DNA-binding NarL/FixJ family response regulator